MSYDPHDTIAALASAAGGAARGIVRISGPRTVEVLSGCFEGGHVSQASPSADASSLQEVRRPTCLAGRFRLEALADRPPRTMTLPADLYVWPGVRSYTREPMAEIHTLGSPPLLAAVLDTLVRRGVRPAEPGEFTLRAFLAGRIDLTQAEAVLGVIDSRDARELDVALAQLAGGLKGKLSALRERLLDLLARLEAGLDFVEDDIEFISRAELTGELSAARDAVSELVAQAASRGHSGQAVRIVLTGEPNAGKSSLFNALADRARDRSGSIAASPAALVSDVPGTTRDWLAVRLRLDGLECELIDTAGAETALDPISAQAQTQRHEQLSAAHVTVHCCDATQPGDSQPSAGPTDLVVWTKCDACVDPPGRNAGCSTSARTGQGLDALLSALRAAALAAEPSAGGVTPATAIRSAASLRLAGEFLDRALERRIPGEEELAAAEIRGALAEIGRIVGAVYTDDILDRIFSRFCIGK